MSGKCSCNEYKMVYREDEDTAKPDQIGYVIARNEDEARERFQSYHDGKQSKIIKIEQWGSGEGLPDDHTVRPEPMTVNEKEAALA